MNQIEQYCKTNKITLTRKRKLVLECLKQADKALSAYELVDFCQLHYGQTVPVMTIYRTLHFLEENLLVNKLLSVNKFVLCSHILCEPQTKLKNYLVCEECKKVEEISIYSPQTANFKASIKELGFTLVRPQIEINGLCGQCSTA